MHVLIPVKRFDAAKSRLASRLAPAQREAIALAMLEDLLAEVAQVRGLSGVAVVSAQPGLAQRLGNRATVLADPGTGLNEAVTQALQHLAERGEDRVLVLHGDLPLARACDLQALIDTHRNSQALVLVPDAAACGTNALMCNLPMRITLQFGRDSLARHQRAAARAGAACVTEPVASLALDVDDSSAMDAVEALGARYGVQVAPRTRALLGRWRQSHGVPALSS
ncbi:2-phospho-L-lactate guanylyltransferase [Caenimonas sp. SL110]|uniref:2-phospho-L-lactate guanylyltransferase n=1 Tax=Caenimonas sp. SL110 TaxID=1450524 RepID=UPI00069FFF19|nr:2-phospho-L-lactate guanylyltransferase [Caenimonas sp. SL110]